MYRIEEKLGTLLGLFGASQWFGAWDIVPHLLHPRYAPGVTLSDEVRNCEICRALNVEALLRTDRSQLRWLGHVSRMPQEKLARHALLAKPQESGPEFVQGLGGVITLRPCLVPSFCGASRTIWDCCWPWGIPSPPTAATPVTLPRGNVGMKMNEMNKHFTSFRLFTGV